MKATAGGVDREGVESRGREKKCENRIVYSERRRDTFVYHAESVRSVYRYCAVRYDMADADFVDGGKRSVFCDRNFDRFRLWMKLYIVFSSSFVRFYRNHNRLEKTFTSKTMMEVRQRITFKTL